MNVRNLLMPSQSMLFLGCLCLPAGGTAEVREAAPSYATNGDPALAALVEESLERNPQIHQAWSDYRAARQRIPQATALPDPTLGITLHARTPETRTGPQKRSIAVSQKIPWFGKRSDQGQIAANHAGIRGETAMARRSEIIRQVKRAYYDLGYIDHAIGITQEEELLLRHYESLAQARYSQGTGLQQAAIRLQAEITRVLNRRQELLRQRLETEAMLNALRDRPPYDAIPVVVPGDRPIVQVDGDRLHAIGRSSRPEVLAARLQLQSQEHGIRLARRQYWPDLVVGASWGAVSGRRDLAGLESPPPDNGKDVYSFTIGVNIPIYRSRYDAAVQEASARRESAREAVRSTVNEVDLAIRSIGLRLTMVEEQIGLFEKALLPQAEQALRSAEEAYSTGAAGTLDLLDSEEVLLDVRLGLARLRSDYMKALADMERAIGSPYPEERS